MMPTRLSITLLFTSLLCTCGLAEKKEAAPEKPVQATAIQHKYPSLPTDRLKFIFENATYMDATFYKLPISINQNSQAQIQSTLAGTGADPMAYRPTCEAIGHIWFQIDGKNVEEADIYFENQCAGYVWYDDGKPAFSNALTESGANFYLNIFRSVDKNVGQ